MNQSTISLAVREARRFIERVEAYNKAQKPDAAYSWSTPKESGALRRASLDLTRALADMRRVDRRMR